MAWRGGRERESRGNCVKFRGKEGKETRKGVKSARLVREQNGLEWRESFTVGSGESSLREREGERERDREICTGFRF